MMNLLIPAAALVPVAAVFIWYKAAKVPLAPLWFFLALALGIIAAALAAFVQYIIFSYIKIENTLFVIFIRIALVEEAGRYGVFLLLFLVRKPASARSMNGSLLNERTAAAAGLVSGLSFAALENAWYALGQPELALLRIISSTPLHASCAARSVRAACLTGAQNAQALPVFVKAVALHGFYNFFASQNFPFFFAPLLAIIAFISQAVFISQKDTYDDCS